MIFRKFGQIRLFLSLLLLSLACIAYPQQKTPSNLSSIPIWKDIEGGETKVVLTPFLPENMDSTTVGIIVCPGGSYCWLDMTTEGYNVAEWLQHMGFAAYVLNYRTTGIFSFVTHDRLLVKGNQHPAMIQDLQRSIQLLREPNESIGHQYNKVGVMGFSAGGHLVMSAGEFYETNFLSPLGITPDVSLRPDFVVPIYPVVTLSDETLVHKRSRRALLGEWRKYNKLMRDSLSLEKHVTRQTPPVFLVNCKDDPTVKYRNSELLDSALCEHGVPHRYLQYNKGGHGFGADTIKASAESIKWKAEFLDWIQTIL